MRTIGSRELKAHLGEVLRRVRDERQSYTVTQHGRAVARIVPARADRDTRSEFEKVWAEMDETMQELSRDWPEGVSAAEAVSEQRREL